MPQVLSGMPRCEMQAYLGEQLAHPAADLYEQKPQRVQLHPANPGPDQPSPDVVEKPVGRNVQQQAELVGKEALAAQPVRL